MSIDAGPIPCLGGPLDGKLRTPDCGTQFSVLDQDSNEVTVYYLHTYEAFGNRVRAFSNHELTPAQEAERLTNHYRQEIASWTQHRPGFIHPLPGSESNL